MTCYNLSIYNSQSCSAKMNENSISQSRSPLVENKSVNSSNISDSKASAKKSAENSTKIHFQNYYRNNSSIKKKRISKLNIESLNCISVNKSETKQFQKNKTGKNCVGGKLSHYKIIKNKSFDFRSFKENFACAYKTKKNNHEKETALIFEFRPKCPANNQIKAAITPCHQDSDSMSSHSRNIQPPSSNLVKRKLSFKSPTLKYKKAKIKKNSAEKNASGLLGEESATNPEQKLSSLIDSPFLFPILGSSKISNSLSRNLKGNKEFMSVNFRKTHKEVDLSRTHQGPSYDTSLQVLNFNENLTSLKMVCDKNTVPTKHTTTDKTNEKVIICDDNFINSPVCDPIPLPLGLNSSQFKNNLPSNKCTYKLQNAIPSISDRVIKNSLSPVLDSSPYKKPFSSVKCRIKLHSSSTSNEVIEEATSPVLDSSQFKKKILPNKYSLKLQSSSLPGSDTEEPLSLVLDSSQYKPTFSLRNSNIKLQSSSSGTINNPVATAVDPSRSKKTLSLKTCKLKEQHSVPNLSNNINKESVLDYSHDKKIFPPFKLGCNLKNLTLSTTPAINEEPLSPVLDSSQHKKIFPPYKLVHNFKMSTSNLSQKTIEDPLSPLMDSREGKKCVDFEKKEQIIKEGQSKTCCNFSCTLNDRFENNNLNKFEKNEKITFSLWKNKTVSIKNCIEESPFNFTQSGNRPVSPILNSSHYKNVDSVTINNQSISVNEEDFYHELPSSIPKQLYKDHLTSDLKSSLPSKNYHSGLEQSDNKSSREIFSENSNVHNLVIEEHDSFHLNSPCLQNNSAQCNKAKVDEFPSSTNFGAVAFNKTLRQINHKPLNDSTYIVGNCLQENLPQKNSPNCKTIPIVQVLEEHNPITADKHFDQGANKTLGPMLALEYQSLSNECYEQFTAINPISCNTSHTSADKEKEMGLFDLPTYDSELDIRKFPIVLSQIVELQPSPMLSNNLVSNAFYGQDNNVNLQSLLSKQIDRSKSVSTRDVVHNKMWEMAPVYKIATANLIDDRKPLLKNSSHRNHIHDETSKKTDEKEIHSYREVCEDENKNSYRNNDKIIATLSPVEEFYDEDITEDHIYGLAESIATPGGFDTEKFICGIQGKVEGQTGSQHNFRQEESILIGRGKLHKQSFPNSVNRKIEHTLWKDQKQNFETTTSVIIEEFDDENSSGKNCSNISVDTTQLKSVRRNLSQYFNQSLPAKLTTKSPCQSLNINNEDNLSEASTSVVTIQEVSQESVYSELFKIECSTSPTTKSSEETQNEEVSGTLSYPPALKVNGYRPCVSDVLDSASKNRKIRVKKGSLVERYRRLMRAERAEVNMFHHAESVHRTSRACSLCVDSTATACSKLVLTCHFADAQDACSAELSAGEERVNPEVRVFIDPSYIKNITSGCTVIVYPPWRSTWLDGQGLMMMYYVTKLRLISFTVPVHCPISPLQMLSNLSHRFHCQTPQSDCHCRRELMRQLFNSMQTRSEHRWAEGSVLAALAGGRYPHDICLRVSILHRFSYRNHKKQIIPRMLCVDSNGHICQLALRSVDDQTKLDSLLKQSDSNALLLQKLLIYKRFNIDRCRGLRDMLNHLMHESVNQHLMYGVTPSCDQWFAQPAASIPTPRHCLLPSYSLGYEGRVHSLVSVIALRVDQLYVWDKCLGSYFKISVTPSAILPSFPARATLNILFLWTHQDELTIDKFSVVTVVENDSEESPAVIPPLSVGAAEGDLILLDSIVTNVNSDVYVRWMGDCGHHMLSVQRTGLFYCVNCTQTVSSCQQQLVLEVCVSDSHVNTPIRVKVKSETAQVLLLGCQGDVSTDKNYNMMGVIGASLKCLAVVLEVLKNPFGDILEFLLEEL